MKRIIIIVSIMIVCALTFASCASSGTSYDTETSSQKADAASADPVEDDFDESLEATGDFTVVAGNGAGKVSISGTTYTITSGGEYTLSGKLEEGCIVVDAGEEDEVTLILADVTVTSSTDAPISFISAAEGTLRAEDGTYNAIYDNRIAGENGTEEEEINGAIYAACDLKIRGSGSLIVGSSFDNGIKSKDDLKIKDVTLKVTSPGVALKGNDSVSVESGSLILRSSGADGIKTSNSHISSKGKQKGTVTLSGGNIEIYAAKDGISAAYDALICEDDGECTVNIYTASYADEGDAGSSSELYVIVPYSTYSESYDYYAYFYNEDGDGSWVKCEYDSMVYSGRSPYYGLLVKAPSGYSSFLVCTVYAGVAPDGENYTGISDGEAFNTSMNGYLISSVSGGNISGDWVTLTTDGSSDKTTYSSKGIKSYNDVTVKAGDVTIYAMDDGIHANSGEELENGYTGTGCITIAGGRITITSADDGIHADETLTVSGGYVNVVKSHEGLEANVVTAAGGEIYINADDDGINACSGSKTPLIKITGGYLDVATPSGDTDAVDSNGNFEMTGGVAIIKSGASMGSMAGSVDVNGSITVTGGTLVAFGGICEVPASSSVNYYVSNGKSFSSGDYVLKASGGDEILTFTLSSEYGSCWIASEEFETDSSYELLCGASEVLSWTQSSQASGDSVQGGMGGPGGSPGGGFPGGGPNG